jgi:hypothetical protein
MVDSFSRGLQSEDTTSLLRVALSAARDRRNHAGLEPFVLIDDSHRLAATELYRVVP